MEETTRSPLTPQQLRDLRAHPQQARKLITLLNAGDKLIDFMEALWPILDPGVPFIRGWAIEAICEHLEAVTKGQIKKLIISVPPGWSKSTSCNVYWPAWEWGPQKRPHERYINTSFDQTLSIRDNIKCRNLILSEEYQLAWGDVFSMSDDQNTKIRFGNDKTGWKAAKAITGLTGERGSRFVFDDPQSVMGATSDAELETIETSFAHAMPTRTQSANDPFIGIMQRLRENDITGFILNNELGFEHLCIPMHYTDNHPHKSRTSLHFVDPRSIRTERAPRMVPSPRQIPTAGLGINTPLAAAEATEHEEVEADKAYVGGQEPIKTADGGQDKDTLTEPGNPDPDNPAHWYTPAPTKANPHPTRVSAWHVGLVAEGFLGSPQQFPPDKVSDLEKTLASKGGTAAIAGQLEQRPYQEGGELFKDEWWKTYHPPLPHPPLPPGTVLVRGWDFAATEKKGSDYTVGVLMARLPRRNLGNQAASGGFVIVDVVRFKGTPGKVRDRVVRTAISDKLTFGHVRTSLPKDPGAGGEWVIADFIQALPGYDIHTSREDRSKEERARPYAAQCEVGYMAIHEDLHTRQAEAAPEGITVAQVFTREHKAFPSGAHDDQVDAASRAFGVLAETRDPISLPGDPITGSPDHAPEPNLYQSSSLTSTSAQASVYEGDGSY